MTLQWLAQDFSVCQVEDYTQTELKGFCFLEKTDAENSLVCESARVPPNTIRREDGWKAFRVVGTLDFSLLGILAKIAGHLADAGVSLFALSTYQTDYILVKDPEKTEKALTAAGYIWRKEEEKR